MASSRPASSPGFPPHSANTLGCAAGSWTGLVVPGGGTAPCRGPAAQDGSWRESCGRSPLPADSRSPLPAAGGSALPAGRGSALPAAGGSALPAGRGSALPAAGGSPLPAVGGSALPAAGGSPLPAGRGSALPAGRGSALPAAGGAGVCGGSAIPGGDAASSPSAGRRRRPARPPWPWSRRSTRWTPGTSREPVRPCIAATSSVPGELTAASRVRPAPAVPSGHGSGCPGSLSRASPDSISGCGRTHPVPGGIVPATIARVVLIRLAMPAAALVYPRQAETAPSAAAVAAPRLSWVNAISSARSAVAVPMPWPSISWMSAGSTPACR
jgi:hypothetical protein